MPSDMTPDVSDHSRETGWPEGVTISVCGGKGKQTPEDIEMLRQMAWAVHDEEWTPEQKAAMARQQETLNRIRERAAARKGEGK